MDPMIGTLFAGRYRLERKLGMGGMATVYYGLHEVLNRPLAVKIIHRRLMQDKMIQGFFKREARAASRIEHPNVTYVFDFGHADDGRPYLAMEFVEGPTLAQLCAGGPMPVPRAVPILHQIALGLGAAHARDVVHRDLKPHNIVLTSHRGQTDVVKILDFGLAKLSGFDGTLEPLSMRDKEFGTPHYMAPEQCQGENVDARADVYGFGVLAYEVLTGTVPFDGPMAKVLWMHINDPAPRVSAKVDVPAPLDDFVARCMAKTPAERFEDGAALAEALQEIAEMAGGSREARGTLKMTMVALNQDGGLTLRESADQLGHDRWAALDDLALMLRDRGLGSALITEALALKLAAEDRLFALEAEVDLLRGEEVHVEMRARERESRLRRAVVQLQHEQKPGGGAAKPSYQPSLTDSHDAHSRAPFETTLRFGSSQVRRARFEQLSHDLADRIGGIVHARDQRLLAIERRVRQRTVEIEQLRAEVEERRKRLATLIKPLKGGEAFRREPDLQVRFLLAGL